MELFTEQEFLEKYSNIESIDEVTINEASEMIFAQVSPCFRDYNWTDGNVPQAIKNAAMEQFKMEAASEVGVNLKQGYNGDISAREAGSVGGQMVKKMIESYENSMK